MLRNSLLNNIKKACVFSFLPRIWRGHIINSGPGRFQKLPCVHMSTRKGAEPPDQTGEKCVKVIKYTYAAGKLPTHLKEPCNTKGKVTKFRSPKLRKRKGVVYATTKKDKEELTQKIEKVKEPTVVEAGKKEYDEANNGLSKVLSDRAEKEPLGAIKQQSDPNMMPLSYESTLKIMKKLVKGMHVNPQENVSKQQGKKEALNATTPLNAAAIDFSALFGGGKKDKDKKKEETPTTPAKPVTTPNAKTGENSYLFKKSEDDNITKIELGGEVLVDKTPNLKKTKDDPFDKSFRPPKEGEPSFDYGETQAFDQKPQHHHITPTDIKPADMKADDTKPEDLNPDDLKPHSNTLTEAVMKPPEAEQPALTISSKPFLRIAPTSSHRSAQSSQAKEEPDPFTYVQENPYLKYRDPSVYNTYKWSAIDRSGYTMGPSLPKVKKASDKGTDDDNSEQPYVHVRVRESPFSISKIQSASLPWGVASAKVNPQINQGIISNQPISETVWKKTPPTSPPSLPPVPTQSWSPPAAPQQQWSPPVPTQPFTQTSPWPDLTPPSQNSWTPTSPPYPYPESTWNQQVPTTQPPQQWTPPPATWNADSQQQQFYQSPPWSGVSGYQHQSGSSWPQQSMGSQMGGSQLPPVKWEGSGQPKLGPQAKWDESVQPAPSVPPVTKESSQRSPLASSFIPGYPVKEPDPKDDNKGGTTAKFSTPADMIHSAGTRMLPLPKDAQTSSTILKPKDSNIKPDDIVIRPRQTFNHDSEGEFEHPPLMLSSLSKPYKNASTLSVQELHTCEDFFKGFTQSVKKKVRNCITVKKPAVHTKKLSLKDYSASTRGLVQKNIPTVIGPMPIFRDEVGLSMLLKIVRLRNSLDAYRTFLRSISIQDHRVEMVKCPPPKPPCPPPPPKCPPPRCPPCKPAPKSCPPSPPKPVCPKPPACPQPNKPICPPKKKNPCEKCVGNENDSRCECLADDNPNLDPLFLKAGFD